MRVRLPLPVLFIALASAVPSIAQSPKPPWRWTLDERLAVINDPAAAATRLRDAVQRGQVSSLAKTASITNPAPSDQVDFISGREHPELLLPWELFDHMMTMAYADDSEVRSIFRGAKDPALTGSGLPADYWNRLEAISVAYLSDVRQIHDLHKRGVSDAAVKRRIATQTHALENLKCRDRAAAIAAARHDFGEKFDQFLYTGIAPNMSSAIARLGRISEAREHEIEVGCQ